MLAGGQQLSVHLSSPSAAGQQVLVMYRHVPLPVYLALFRAAFLREGILNVPQRGFPKQGLCINFNIEQVEKARERVLVSKLS